MDGSPWTLANIYLTKDFGDGVRAMLEWFADNKFHVLPILGIQVLKNGWIKTTTVYWETEKDTRIKYENRFSRMDRLNPKTE